MKLSWTINFHKNECKQVIKTITQIIQGSRDGSAKKQGNKGRSVATNVMKHPCYILLATEMKCIKLDVVAEPGCSIILVATNLPLSPFFLALPSLLPWTICVLVFILALFRDGVWANWNVITKWSGDIQLLLEEIVRLVTNSSEFESTRSRILPLTWVGRSINWVSELSKTDSQKLKHLMRWRLWTECPN